VIGLYEFRLVAAESVPAKNEAHTAGTSLGGGTEHHGKPLNGSEAFSFKRYTVPDALTLGAALAGAMSVGI